MSALTTRNVKISGMAVRVPKCVEKSIDLPVFALHMELNGEFICKKKLYQ